MTFDRSEFLSTFHDEAKDHLQKLNEGLLALEKDPGNEQVIEEMFREGHTLKGAARMMGFNEIKEVSHYIEDIFGSIHNKKITLDQELCTLLLKSLDTISAILEQVVAGKNVTVPWEKTVADLKQAFEDSSSGKKKKNEKSETLKKKPDAPASKKSPPPPAKSASKNKSSEPDPPKMQSPAEDSAAGGERELSFDDVKRELEEKGLLNIPLEDYTQGGGGKPAPVATADPLTQAAIKQAHHSGDLEEYIKVPVTKINKLLNLVGEMVINKINSAQKINSLRRLVKISRYAHKKLQDNVAAILNHSAIQQISMFKDLKTGLYDLTHDVMELREEASSLFDDISMEVSQLDPIVDELQLRMKQIRMLPVGSVFETMPRLVRDIAVAQGKKIDLVISGEETELDKKVLESIKGALIHLLRNSVDHGIELPEERESRGKNPKGTIALRAYHKGGNVIIEIEDDGRGMHMEKIKETAVRKGLATAHEVGGLSEQEVLAFVFFPGFSTAPIITDISGRGVGLDVVKTDIENLKGSITVKTEAGKSTLFTLQLPLTVAIIQALLVRVQNEIFAIPLLSVEESICIPKAEIFSIENRPAIRLRNRTISVVPLNDILRVPAVATRTAAHKNKNADNVFVVILNSLEKLLGIEVDEIIGEQEIFIKSLDENLGKLKNVSGATVLGSGQVIVILDVGDLFESCKITTTHARVSTSIVESASVSNRKKRILIAEDSLTTRELERSILESHGYEVDTAIDGLDALNKAQAEPYDLVVSDIEMPRMEGFELCKAIRQNPDLRDLPVVIVTSLDREEDKRRGIEVGAQAYIVKSAFDQASLVDTVKRLIG